MIIAQNKERVESLKKRLAKAKGSRQWWESQWQDVKELIRPNTTDFNRSSYQGDRKFDRIYESTAVDACEEFAGGLSSYMTNPSDRWFSLTVEGMSDPRSSIGIRGYQWLEAVSNIIYQYYSSSSSNYSGALHESYMDLGSFGTQVLHQYWDANLGKLIFKSIPLADCWFMENHQGKVDTIWRRVNMTIRQIEQRFGHIPPELARQKNHDQDFEVYQYVFPRKDRDAKSKAKLNKPFGSIWWVQTTGELLDESGFDWFPFHISRWTKLAGEVYGRGPGMKVLPDVKVINRLEATMLKAGAKAIDPPLQVPNDGFMLPLKTHPGALLFKEPQSENIEPLATNPNLPFGLELMDQKRETIRSGFYNDLLRMGKEKVEMTAYETQDRREEKLRLISPMLGRQENELLGPKIELSFNLLNRAGKIPEPPPEIQGREMTIEYTSPASKAQTGVRAMAMDRYIQRILPMAQANPQILDRIDFDAWTKELAMAMGTPVTIVRDDNSLQEVRKGNAEAAQQQQMIDAAEPASKAVKNFAEAQQLVRNA